MCYCLFAHAFTGCDTMSAIHMFGKTTIFKKIHSPTLRNIALPFYEPHTPDDNGDKAIRFFELLHSSLSSLPLMMKSKYEQMVSSNRTNIDPSLLPPSPRAAFFHGLIVYHQVKVWRELNDTDDMPLLWG